MFNLKTDRVHLHNCWSRVMSPSREIAGRPRDTKDTPYFDAWQYPDVLWREAVSHGNFPIKVILAEFQAPMCLKTVASWLLLHKRSSKCVPMRDWLFGKRLYTSASDARSFLKDIFGPGAVAGSLSQREIKYVSLLIALWLSTKNTCALLSEKDLAMNRSRQRMTCICGPAGIWRVPASREENWVQLML